VNVELVARRDETTLQVMIRNTGSLNTASGGAGIGLRNCRERLELLYAGRATLELDQRAGEVAVKVTLPYRKHAP
jgi:LytS/YehU family sensor histidine kinase